MNRLKLQLSDPTTKSSCANYSDSPESLEKAMLDAYPKQSYFVMGVSECSLHPLVSEHNAILTQGFIITTIVF